MITPYRTTVPFRDIDMHGHMHNAAYLSHFEAAISGFLRQAGLSDHFAPGGDYVYHVRKASVTFHAPTHYDEDIEIHCAPGHIGRTSLRFDGRVTGSDGDLRATTEVIWICVGRAAGGPTPLPDPVRLGLERHVSAD